MKSYFYINASFSLESGFQKDISSLPKAPSHPIPGTPPSHQPWRQKDPSLGKNDKFFFLSQLYLRNCKTLQLNFLPVNVSKGQVLDQTLFNKHQLSSSSHWQLLKWSITKLNVNNWYNCWLSMKKKIRTSWRWSLFYCSIIQFK